MKTRKHYKRCKPELFSTEGGDEAEKMLCVSLSRLITLEKEYYRPLVRYLAHAVPLPTWSLVADAIWISTPDEQRMIADAIHASTKTQIKRYLAQHPIPVHQGCTEGVREYLLQMGVELLRLGDQEYTADPDSSSMMTSTL